MAFSEVTEQYRENFIAAMFRVMGEHQFNQSEFADWLQVGRVTIHKITQRKQLPTVEQGITLCLKANLDANWLFLNRSREKQTFKPLPPAPPIRAQRGNRVAAKR